MIPIIEENGINRTPEGVLPSVKDFFKMVWGHHNDNISGFRGISTVCCKVILGSIICQVYNTIRWPLTVESKVVGVINFIFELLLMSFDIFLFFRHFLLLRFKHLSF